MAADRETRAELERIRGEIRRVDEQIREVTAGAMALTGMRGAWARLTGTFEQRIEEAEVSLTVLREELAIHTAALAEATAA